MIKNQDPKPRNFWYLIAGLLVLLALLLLSGCIEEDTSRWESTGVYTVTGVEFVKNSWNGDYYKIEVNDSTVVRLSRGNVVLPIIGRSYELLYRNGNYYYRIANIGMIEQAIKEE